jgi:TRAP-type mannitol/chloroaromatic compound transport system permease small subunit
MIRIVVQELALFLLPFALYAVYFAWKRWHAKRTGAEAPTWERGTWFWLVVAGLVLAIAGIVAAYFLLQDGRGPFQPPSR